MVASTSGQKMLRTLDRLAYLFLMVTALYFAASVALR